MGLTALSGQYRLALAPKAAAIPRRGTVDDRWLVLARAVAWYAEW
jgi:hypothetical protein